MAYSAHDARTGQVRHTAIARRPLQDTGTTSRDVRGPCTVLEPSNPVAAMVDLLGPERRPLVRNLPILPGMNHRRCAIQVE